MDTPQRRHPHARRAHEKALRIPVKEMPTKTAPRYLLKPVRRALFKRETDLQTQKASLWLPKRKEGGKGRIGSTGLADTYCYI